ncbi:MAG: hypothetical protein PVI86_01960 [Phycisphaerae bacterium]
MFQRFIPWNPVRVSSVQTLPTVPALCSLTTDDNVSLLNPNMGTGQGSAFGRYDALRSEPFDHGFFLEMSGVAA